MVTDLGHQVESYYSFCDIYLFFMVYTFILYQQLMGSLRKRYSRTTLTNFTETLEAFLTSVSYKFFCWLKENE